MSNLTLSLVAFLILLFALILEKSVLKRRREKLKIVVQVNGTRGKSETVRLIHGTLRGNGYRVLGKTTGTVPLWIMLDGNHVEIKRNGPANIQEQYKAFKRAEELKCDALVVECMAIKPEMQLASGKILSADLTVITNAYPDHIQEIGASEEETAKVLSLSVPPGRKCLVGNFTKSALLEVQGRCEKIITEMLLATDVSTISDTNFTFKPHPDNLKLIEKVIEIFKLNRENALRGMSETLPDIGTFRYFRLNKAGKDVVIANAFAANDIRSTEYLLERTKLDFPNRKLIGFFNSRDDRPDRAIVFESLMKKFDKLIVRGPVPKRIIKGLDYHRLEDAEMLINYVENGDVVFGFGNIRGLVKWLGNLEVVE